MTVKANEEKCTGCGVCVEVCPANAIKIVDDKAVISAECIECSACINVCPNEAISFPEKEVITMPYGDGTGPLGQGPGTGRGRGRRGGRGRMGGNRPGSGPGGSCVCPSCGVRVSHQVGIPCYSVSCPKCGAKTVKE